MFKLRFEGLRLPSLLLACILFLTGVMVMPLPVRGSGGSLVGVICIAGSTSTSCPSIPPVFTGRVGSQLVVSVNVQGSNETYGFDVAVKTDSRVLDPVSIDYSGWIFTGHGSFVAVQCVDGAGLGCQLQDGPGVAHVVVTGLNSETLAPTTGRLFRVTYNILGSGPVKIGFQTGCSAPTVTSVPPDTCVTVVMLVGPEQNISVTDPETVQPALFTHIQGDVNYDCTVDISDLSIVGGAFGSSPGSLYWIPIADINGDGVVDIRDLAIVGSDFGQSCF